MERIKIVQICGTEVEYKYSIAVSILLYRRSLNSFLSLSLDREFLPIRTIELAIKRNHYGYSLSSLIFYPFLVQISPCSWL